MQSSTRMTDRIRRGDDGDDGDAQVNEVELIGATGFEPATFRPPAEGIQVSMCLGASVVSYVSRTMDDLDR
jgi:hypothetical protein